MRKFDFNLCNFSVKRMGATLSTLLVTMLATTMVSCEPNECPNVTPRGEEEGNTNTANGVQIVLEIEDEHGNMRTVSGDSNYSFTELGKGGTIQVEGTGFQPTQDLTNKVNVNLTFHAQENVVFQGWSWRYEEDPKGTHRKVHESTLNDFIPTPAIQVESGVQRLDIKEEDTSFTCYYHPERSNKVYVKVKYAKIEPSKATYHWDVKGPLQGSHRTGFPYFGLIRHRRPEIFIVDSYITIEGIDMAFDVDPIVKIDAGWGISSNLYYRDSSRLGRFYVTLLHDESFINDQDIQYNWSINQNPAYKKYLGYSEARNASGVLTIPHAKARDLDYRSWNGNHVVIRFDMNYDCVVSIRNMWNGYVNGDITIQFAYTNGYIIEKKYSISLSNVERENPKFIDFLPDIIRCTPVSLDDLSIGLKHIKLIESKCDLTFTDYQGVKMYPPKQTWFDFIQ